MTVSGAGREPDREVLAVARELAKAAIAEAVRIMGEDATTWADLKPERRARAIAAMMPMAQLAVDTIAATRILRVIEHPSLALVRDQFDKADAKGYTRAHDREHGAGPLIRAAKAYTVEVATRLSCGIEGDGVHLWPFKDGWNPDPDPALTLVKAAHLLLSAADVITAEQDSATDGAA